MQQGNWEVVILKPTPVFLSFLSAQVPDFEFSNLKLLQTDATAYAIPRHDNDEATLDEIEKHFPTMFRHEISRWLGQDARNEIEGSFLDFLCCFKFQMHSQIVLMEPEFKNGNQLLCIKPRSILLKWMKKAVEGQNDLTEVLERVDVSHLSENATVVIKNFHEISEIKPFIHQYFRPIFKAEMHRMCDEADLWPDVSTFEDFNRYFSVEVHTQLIHLH